MVLEPVAGVKPAQAEEHLEIVVVLVVLVQLRL
jgi:hypothetical protein